VSELFTRASKPQAEDESQARLLNCSGSAASQKPEGWGKLQMALEWLKESHFL
jgi:hypothetical protein